MSAPALRLDDVRVLLCDADGNLFPSEEPAFEASTVVTNRLLADLGVAKRFDADELRRRAMGRTFRLTALDLAAEHGVQLPDAELERRVQEEREHVIAHLAAVLEPDPEVLEPLQALAGRFQLTVVSSSALQRLAACFTAAGLDDLFPVQWRYSAEDSLPVPTSKPDPAVYAHARRELGIDASEGLAVEDSTTGARSALAAGFQCVGNLVYVAADEREERVAALRECGVEVVVESWRELEGLLQDAPRLDTASAG